MVSFCADAPLAQLAEQLTLNQWVPGSSPGGRTNKNPPLSLVFQGIFSLPDCGFLVAVATVQLSRPEAKLVAISIIFFAAGDDFS